MFEKLHGKLLVIMEFETSGHDAARHEIIELAAIFAKLDDKGLHMMDVCECMVKPEHIKTANRRHLKKTAFNKKVWDACARDAKFIMKHLENEIEDIMEREKLSQIALIGDGMTSRFDFFTRALVRADVKWLEFHILDIENLASVSFGSPNLTFTKVCAKLNISVNPPPRKALNDAITVYGVLDRIIAKA